MPHYSRAIYHDSLLSFCLAVSGHILWTPPSKGSQPLHLTETEGSPIYDHHQGLYYGTMAADPLTIA